MSFPIFDASVQEPPGAAISILIPAYRSGQALRPLFVRLKDSLEQLRIPYEIIFVDDASPDDSWNVLTQIQKELPDRITLIRLAENTGQHNALLCGFSFLKGRYIVTMDDDLQHRPEDIGTLYRAITESGNDLVYGAPRRKRHAFWRNAGSFVVQCFLRSACRLPVTASSFRIMKRELAARAARPTPGSFNLDLLLARCKPKTSRVILDHNISSVPSSRYTPGKLARFSLTLVSARFCPKAAPSSSAWNIREIRLADR